MFSPTNTADKLLKADCFPLLCPKNVLDVSTTTNFSRPFFPDLDQSRHTIFLSLTVNAIIGS